MPRFPIVTGARIFLLVAGAVVAVDLVRAWPHLVRPSTPALTLGATLVGLTAWTALSAKLWGCFCGGTFYGLAEFTAFTVLALTLGSQAPERCGSLLTSAATGVMLAGGLALLGLRSLHSSVAFDPNPGSRLEGIYGNRNYLAYAVALSIPVFAVCVHRLTNRGRLVAMVGLILAATVVLLTFSRSGLIAAAVGGLVALTADSSRRRRTLAIMAAGCSAAVFATFLVHGYYSEARLRADFGSTTVGALNARDRSGWDGSAQGLIPRGNSSLTNERNGTVLRVSAPVAMSGVSYPWGLAKASHTYVLGLHASAARRVTLGFALEDNLAANGAVHTYERVSRAWRPISLSWTPSAQSPEARLYVWAGDEKATFRLRDVRVEELAGRAAPAVRKIGLRLRGPIGVGPLEQAESRFLQSRWDGLHLSLSAFADQPLRGIGWEQFPAYAAKHSVYGELASHNEYARIVAELGLLGLLAICTAAVALVMGVLGGRRTAARSAALGVLASGAVALLFINGLVAASASLPLAAAIANLASPRKGDRAGRRGA
jgi:O-antigen ligase